MARFVEYWVSAELHISKVKELVLTKKCLESCASPYAYCMVYLNEKSMDQIPE